MIKSDITLELEKMNSKYEDLRNSYGSLVIIMIISLFLGMSLLVLLNQGSRTSPSANKHMSQPQYESIYNRTNELQIAQTIVTQMKEYSSELLHHTLDIERFEQSVHNTTSMQADEMCLAIEYQFIDSEDKSIKVEEEHNKHLSQESYNKDNNTENNLQNEQYYQKEDVLTKYQEETDNILDEVKILHSFRYTLQEMKEIVDRIETNEKLFEI